KVGLVAGCRLPNCRLLFSVRSIAYSSIFQQFRRFLGWNLFDALGRWSLRWGRRNILSPTMELFACGGRIFAGADTDSIDLDGSGRRSLSLSSSTFSLLFSVAGVLRR